MTLTLTLRTQPPARIAAGALDTRAAARARRRPRWPRLTVRCGRETLTVGDLFEVSGAGDEQLVFAGDLRRVDGIGAGDVGRPGAGGGIRAATTSALA